METTTVYDCIGANLGKFDIPPGVLMAGYDTGSGDVPWTAEQFTQHPEALHIDQAPVNTARNELADIIDIEPLAATLADLAGWVAGATRNYHAGTRPGQRWPTAYMSQGNVTPVANTLVAAHIDNGVNLFVSEPMARQQAQTLLDHSGGPYPIVGVQYEFHELYDVSLVSKAWLDNVSKAPVKPQPESGTQGGWRFCRKCKGMFYGPEQSSSRCPVGAQHDGSDSYNYTLGYTQ